VREYVRECFSVLYSRYGFHVFPLKVNGILLGSVDSLNGKASPLPLTNELSVTKMAGI